MRANDKIEQCLASAPKPAPPDGLLGRLQEDLAAVEMKERVTVLRRWFAPAGGAISPRRVAAAAAMALAALLPLSYGATVTVRSVVKRFEARFEYPEDSRAVAVGAAVGSSDGNLTEAEAQAAEREFYELYKQGNAREVRPGLWVAMLSNGRAFGYSGDPELLGLSEAEREEHLKRRADEINKLKRAGAFEKTYRPEHDFTVNGVTYRYYEARYTLSDGTVVTVGGSEPAEDEH